MVDADEYTGLTLATGVVLLHDYQLTVVAKIEVNICESGSTLD